MDTWYIQPLEETQLRRFLSDGNWTNWTHTGASYAAILVQPGYSPQAKRTILPAIGDDVLAETIVEGVKQ